MFFYSFGRAGYVNLAPAMDLKIEESISSDTSGAPRYRGTIFAQYQVESRGREGIAMRLVGRSHRKQARLLSTGQNAIFTLSHRFSSKPAIRLFLQSMSPAGATRDPMLLESSDVHKLDAATRQIEELGISGCTGQQTGVNCLSFKQGTVSLFVSINVNGRATLYTFGTSLAQVLERLPVKEKVKILATVQVNRKQSTGNTIEVGFPRSEDGTHQLILLPGDSVRWKL